MDTLLLAQNSWDLTVTQAGNIAVATNGYAIAQDVASQCRLFSQELLFDRSQGLPYFTKILGQLPPTQFLKAQFNAAALSVPGVATAQTFLSFDPKTRVLSGQVQVTTTAGQTFTVGGPIQGNVPWYVVGATPQALGSISGGP